MMTDHEYAMSGARFVARKYALTRSEAERLTLSPHYDEITRIHAAFVRQYAVAETSPLAQCEMTRLFREYHL